MKRPQTLVIKNYICMLKLLWQQKMKHNISFSRQNSWGFFFLSIFYKIFAWKWFKIINRNSALKMFLFVTTLIFMFITFLFKLFDRCCLLTKQSLFSISWMTRGAVWRVPSFLPKMYNTTMMTSKNPSKGREISTKHLLKQNNDY